jgi:hypothetical protein
MIGQRFVRGVNLPWLRYGCDFGRSAWFPDGGLASGRDRVRLRAALEAIAAERADLVRWFVLCDGRSGLRERGTGAPGGLDDALLEDFEVAVGEVSRVGLQMFPVLIDFHWGLPARHVRGVQAGGRLDVLRDPEGREALLQRVLRPLLARYGHEPTIAAWDLFNEPEWITLGVGRWNPYRAADAADIRAFVRDAATLVHEVTVQPVTMGSASPAWLGLVQDLGLDFYAPHWYADGDPPWPLERRVATLGLDGPVVLGEFGAQTAGEALRLEAAARDAGYAGALAWRTDSEPAFDST